MIKSYSLNVEISDASNELLEVLGPDFDPYTRRLIIELGIDTFNICKDYITKDDKRNIIEQIRKKIEEEFKTKSVEYKTKSILLEKQNLELKEQLEFLRQQVLEKEAHN